jgi:hypothetical protein
VPPTLTLCPSRERSRRRPALRGRTPPAQENLPQRRVPPSVLDSPGMPGRRWYIDLMDRRQPWERPLTPLLHTKGQNCTNNAPVVEIPENATTVEIIINNLSPTAHLVHLHGFTFKVINFANFQWCSLNKTSAFERGLGLSPRSAY